MRLPAVIVSPRFATNDSAKACALWIFASAFVVGYSVFGISPGWAQTQLEDRARQGVEADEDIVINGIRNPAGVSAKQFSAMLRAFAKHKARYAPQSTFFITYDEPTGPGADPPALKLVSANESITLPVDVVNRRVEVPSGLAPKGNYRLTTNRSRKALDFSLLIASSGTGEDVRTLGDLRLQCEVMWAAVKEETTFLIRAAFGAAGACKSRRIAFYFPSPRPLSRAVLVHAGQQVPLELSPTRRGYRAPIYDQKLPSSARVQLYFG